MDNPKFDPNYMERVDSREVYDIEEYLELEMRVGEARRRCYDLAFGHQPRTTWGQLQAAWDDYIALKREYEAKSS